MTPDAAYEAAQNQDIVLIDIRRPEEWLQTGVAEGAIGLDMTQPGFVPALLDLRQRYPDRPLAMICRTGNRTNYVTSELAKQGFPGLIDVSEGMVGGRNGPGWLARKLPTYEGRLDAVKTRTEAVLNPKP
jgi:rhodanese-related sulfurtransferase